MTVAVGSSTAAGYVAAAAGAAPGPSGADGSMPTNLATAASAATPVGGSAPLAPETVAALVAQQASDAGDTAPIPASPTATAAPTSTAPTSTAPASTADVFAGASDLVRQVQHYASQLVDGSGASDADKATAMAQLFQLRFKVGGSATDPSRDDWFTQSNAAQRQAVEAQIDGSSFFQQAVAAASRFNATGIGLARAGTTGGSNSEAARFAQLSTAQQTLIWAGGFSQFQSLDDFKSYLAQQAAGNAAMQAASGAGPGRTADADTAGGTALDASAAPADPVAQMAKSVLASSSGQTMADVALAMLKTGAAKADSARADSARADSAKADSADADSPPATMPRVSVAA